MPNNVEASRINLYVARLPVLELMESSSFYSPTSGKDILVTTGSSVGLATGYWLDDRGVGI
jgi:hypothetical protein